MRQYIGARYVPKFMGTYDATQAYEALCVVDNGMGTSYISTVPTPAGTPLTDTDHWAIYGATSGAIINLQNQIDAITNTTLPAITADIGNVSDLETPITTDLVSAINSIGSRKVVFIADSYASSGRGGYTDGIFTTFREYAGMDASNSWLFQAPGVGFANTYLGENFYTLAQAAISALTTEALEITDVIIAGGCNDANYTYSDIYTAKNNCVELLHGGFPNAVIRISPNFGARSHPSRNYHNFNTYPAYTTIAHDYERPILNAPVPMLTLDCYENGENIHPNAKGVKEIGYLIGGAFASDSNYGYVNSAFIQAAVTYDAGYTQGASSYINTIKSVDGVRINSCKSWAINGAFSVAWNTGMTQQIGRLSNFIVSNIDAVNSYASSACIPVDMMFYVSSSEQHLEKGELLLTYDSNYDEIVCTLKVALSDASFTASQVTILPFDIQLSEFL